MVKINIRKRISLEFLGEEYKEGYFIFTTIPLSEYEKLTGDMDAIKDDSKKAIPFMLDLLQSHFIEGKFPNDNGELEDVSKEDLSEIDQPTCIEIFSKLTGQADPKPEGLSPTS